MRFRAKAPKKESAIDASSSRGVGVNDTVPMTAELEEFFCDELARYFANGNDRALFLKIAVAEGMDPCPESVRICFRLTCQRCPAAKSSSP